MAHIDLTNRRLELTIVLWGPAGSGVTTALRFLHGACPPHARGELACLEHTDGARVVCDYAPLDLPRWGEHLVRTHVYTMGAGDGLRGAQRRILGGADAVLFVADSRPAGAQDSTAAWRELDQALTSMEDRGRRVALQLAANFCDVPGSASAEQLSALVTGLTPARRLLGAAPTCASAGQGVLACFAASVLAALEAARPHEDPARSSAIRRAFEAALVEQFHGPAGQTPAHTPRTEARRVQLPSAQGISDGTGLHMALDVSRWLALRELDVRRLQRERALGTLLLSIGQTCLAATDVEGLARRVLGSLSMNLDAVSGWLGLPEGSGTMRVYDPLGVAADGSAFTETAEALGLGVRDGGVAPVGPETGALLPGGAVGGRGLFAPFPVGDGRRGWLLLVGPPDRGLPEDADAVLATAGAFVGLTLARLKALQRLRESNAALEVRVEARTQELQREKQNLELRVRERTQELELAKRATLEAERRLLDRERDEGVQRLAAGLAHELNNPIGAALSNLDFVLDGLQRLAASVTGLVGAELAELLSATSDARRDMKRVATQVTSLFGQAASSRREAMRTPLVGAVKEAVATFATSAPGARPPRVHILQPVACGVPPAECSRWLFRLLSALAQARAPALQVEVGRVPEGPHVRVSFEGAHTAAVTGALAPLVLEVERAGARLVAADSPEGSALELLLPPALGESGVYATPRLEAAR